MSAHLSVRVALVNDVPLVVHGLRAMLEPHADRVSVVDVITDREGSDRRPTKFLGADVALLDSFGVEDIERRVHESSTTSRHG